MAWGAVVLTHSLCVIREERNPHWHERRMG